MRAHTSEHQPKAALWVGVGWGGVGIIMTKLGALPGHEDTSHWSDVQLYQIFLWVGWGGVGWGGVGTITNLAALHGPEDYAGRLLICINIFLFLGVGWGP